MISRPKQHIAPGAPLRTMALWHRRTDRRAPWAGIVCIVAPFVGSVGVCTQSKLTWEERAP